MKRFGRGPVVVAALVLALFGLQCSTAQAVEAIVNGGLEDSQGPHKWTLTQSITGMPGLPVSATEHLDGAAYPMPAEGELGLVIYPFAGNIGVYEGQNLPVNVSLSQIFNLPGTGLGSPVGKTFLFKGHSLFQNFTSAYVTTLDASSPSGAIPSPTQSNFTVEFLNSSNGVLATHTIDLRTDRGMPPTLDAWYEHMMTTPAAPAGTAKARVSANFTDLVQSCTGEACPGGQDIYIDDFSLFQNGTFGGERLDTPPPDGNNGDLNTNGAPTGWSLVKTAQDNVQFSTQSYAIHSGNVGMWIRAFNGGDVKIVQTVPGVAGEDYTFSGWSKWEIGYIGADPFSATQTFMTMEFLDGSGTPIEITPGVDDVYLDLRTVQLNDDTWRELTLPTTEAPLGTVSVRVSAGATGLGNSGINPQSAMFDDFSLITTAVVGVPGDFNDDGIVDAADYARWRANDAANDPLPNDDGLATQAERYTLWVDNFGNTAPGSGGGAGAVPEPSSLVLLLGIALGLVAAGRRGNR